MRNLRPKSQKTAKTTGNKSVDRVVNDIYNEINKLINSVNTPFLNSEIKTKDGKPGDIRIVEDKSFSVDPKGSPSAFFLEAKTSEGWVRQYMDKTEHSGVSREGTIPTASLKLNTKKDIKQGSLSFWKADSGPKFSSNKAFSQGIEVYINENVKIGKNAAKNLEVTGTLKLATPADGDASAENILVHDTGDGLVKKRSYAQILSDLGIAADEIIDWTTDQGSTNIHKANFNEIELADNKKIAFGNDNDFKILHNGNHSFIKDEGTGNFYLQTNGDRIIAWDGANTQNLARFNTAGSVDLYYNGNKKLDTTNTGVNITGTLEFDSLSDGAITITDFVDEDNMSSNSATKIPTQQSVKAYVDNEVAGLVDSAPAALDTLNELAAALNDDASFSTTITNSLATKVSLTGDETIAGNKTFSGLVKIAAGGPQLIFADTTDDDDHKIQFWDESNNTVHIIRTSDNTGGGLGDSLCIGSVENKPLQLITQNATRMVIDGSGSVGIGVTDPDSRLEVVSAGNDNSTYGLSVKNSSDTSLFYVRDDGVVSVLGGYFFAQHANGAYFNGPIRARNGITNDDGSGALSLGANNSTNSMTLINGGNVGIGTTSPATNLHIHKEMSNNADNSLMTIQGDLASGDLGTEKVLIDFTMTDSNANNYPQVKIGAAVGRNADADSLEKEGSGAFVVYTSAGTSNTDGEDNTAERMRVDYLGNVGIGTTTPSSPLHIVSGSGNTLTPALRLSKLVNDDGSDGGTATGILMGAGDTGDLKAGIFAENAGAGNYRQNLIFAMENTTDNANADLTDEVMRITYDGKVGIGTTTPGEKLAVAGNIAVTGTVDGRDLQTDGTKLDGIEAGATADQTTADIISLLNTDLGGNFTIGNQTDDMCTFTGPLKATGTIFAYRQSYPQLSLSDDNGTDKMYIGVYQEDAYIEFMDDQGAGSVDRLRFRGDDQTGSGDYSNADVMTINFANNRVGINTTAPGAALDVQGTGWASKGIRVKSTTTSGAVLELETTQRGFEIASRDNGFNIRDTDGDTSRFTISSGGNISFHGGAITSGEWQGTAIAHAYIGNDAIDGDNIADDSVNSEHYVDGSIDNQHIAGTTIAFDKIATAAYQTNGQMSSPGFANNDTTFLTAAAIKTYIESYGYITATLTDEQIQDKVGAMFSGNTETGITATYVDGDNNIDLVVDDTTKLPLAGGDMTGHLQITATDAGHSGSGAYVPSGTDWQNVLRLGSTSDNGINFLVNDGGTNKVSYYTNRWGSQHEWARGSENTGDGNTYQPMMRLTSNDSNTNLQLYDGTTNGVNVRITAESSNDTYFNNSANNVAIGSTSAGGYKLKVTGTANVTGDATFGSGIVLGGHTMNDIDITSEVSDADDHLMTALAIKNKIEDYGYTTAQGDIERVQFTADVAYGGDGGISVVNSGNADFTLSGAGGITTSTTSTSGEIQISVGTLNQDTTGNAATATNATNASWINVTENSTEDATHYIAYVDGTSSNQQINVDTGFTYNPNSGQLTYAIANLSSGIHLGNADTTLTRASAGDVNIEGNIVYRAGGTDVPVADGGTGASNASDARSNLGISYANIGTVDISANTNLSAGTNITLSGDTLNVDDAFLINDGDDTTTGTITAGGFTTTGTWTFDEHTSGTVGITTVQDSGTNFVDNDTSLMTAGAISDYVTSLGYTSNSGDITSVRFTCSETHDPSYTNTLLVSSGAANFALSNGNGINVAGNSNTNTAYFNVTPAQTTISSMLNTSLVVGRDADNQIKFSTDDQIIFKVAGGDGVTFKASGEIEATKFDGALEGNADTATLASTVTVTDSTGNTNRPVVFHDGSNALLDNASDFSFNPSTGILVVPKIKLTSNVLQSSVGNTVMTTSGDDATFTDNVTVTDTLTFAGLNDGSNLIIGFLDENDMSSDSDAHLATQQSIKAYVDSKIKSIDWTRSTGGYFTANDTTPRTQSYEGDETWGNTVTFTAIGVGTYISYSDVYAGIWVAPADAKVTKCNMVVRNLSYADDLTIKLWAVNPATNQATLLFDHDITMPNTSSVVAVNQSISSSNSIAEGYVLFPTIEKQATSGTTRHYFSWTVSGTFD